VLKCILKLTELIGTWRGCDVTKADVLAHYKTGKAVAEALGLSESAVSQWPESIPRLRAFELERITGGVLRVDGACAAKKAA